MKAIPTTYRGTLFRSRLEAQWAEFLDVLGIAWQYEPEGYTNGPVRYLPDFWLPTVLHRGARPGVFFEVKPSSPLAGEVDKALMLACGSRKPVLVVVSSPKGNDVESLHEYVRDGDRDWDDDGLCFAGCDACGAVSVNVWITNQRCPCGLDDLIPGMNKLCVARNSFAYYGRWKGAA